MSVACGEESDPPAARADAAAITTDSFEAGALAPSALDAGSVAPSLYDATIRTVQDCKPGTYRGKYMCIVDEITPWGGEVSFTLEQRGSADVELSTLYISPDTVLMGKDDVGGTFKADMKGSVDCATGKLTGSLDNGRYSNFLLDLALAGSLSGTYAGGATPSFSGQMGPLKSPDLDFGGLLSSPMADCTWSATLQ